MERGLWHKIAKIDTLYQSKQTYRQFCHVGIGLEIAYLVYSKMLHLRGDQRDSKSTWGSLLCVLGSHTFVPISWMCKKETEVSHSSAESESIISLDAGLRVDGLSALQFLECLGNIIQWASLSVPSAKESFRDWYLCFWVIWHFPPNIPNSSHSTQLHSFEDSAAVIQRTQPKRKVRHKNAQGRFGLVVWESEFGSFYFEQVRASQRSIGGYFDKENLLAGMLLLQKAEGNLLQVDTSAQVFDNTSELRDN